MKRLALLALAFAATASLPPITKADSQMPALPCSIQRVAQQHPYVGMWLTADRQVRHELLPNGRYDEARGTRESAYQGRYEVSGNRIEYWDDTGFTADGVFVDEHTLHHGGMILRRER